MDGQKKGQLDKYVIKEVLQNPGEKHVVLTEKLFMLEEIQQLI